MASRLSQLAHPFGLGLDQVRIVDCAYNLRARREKCMKVLLVDDHPLFREGLSMLLKNLMSDVETCEAGSSEAALSQVASQSDIDLILMDLGLPDMSGLEAIKLMRERHTDIPVVALSSSDDKATVLRALDNGAMGFVPKSANSAILAGALRLILAHGIYLPPSVFLGERPAPTAERASQPGNGNGTSAARTPGDLGLTARQGDVLLRILQGKSAKVISRELNLSASTVKTHTSAVLRALNVTTRTQAIIAAGKLGLRF
jgi:DNA-binding NarL/FixJ family response regulator